MKADDSSLTLEQYATVKATAKALLDKGSGWEVFPTPVDRLMSAAGLELATISAFDEGAMRRYLRQAGEKAHSILKGALDKVLGILDVHADVVHIDPTLYKDKQTFLKLHETGHKELPHQRGLFRWIQDCAKHLDPATAELFEREANMFASIVLFQDDGFQKQTIDEPFGVKAPLRVAKKFGASVYASFREYVRKHHKTCAVIVLEKSSDCPIKGPTSALRRIETSAGFKLQFSGVKFPLEVTVADDLFKLIPFEPQRISRARSFQLTDDNGLPQEFVGEGFRSGYNTLILIHHVASLGKF